jgi:hypothetical protein
MLHTFADVWRLPVRTMLQTGENYGLGLRLNPACIIRSGKGWLSHNARDEHAVGISALG